MINANDKTVLNEIVMPIMSFENGEVIWINNRGKEILNIKSIADLKKINFLEYLDHRQIGQKSLREVVSEVSAAFNKKDVISNKVKVAIKIKGIRMETILTIVPYESDFPNSGTVIFDRLRRKEDVQVRRETEHFYGNLFKQVSTPIMICDSSSKIVEINDAFHDLFGYLCEEAVGKYCYDLIAIPDGKIAFMEICEKINSEGVLNKKMKVIDKWGGLIDIEITAHPILQDGKVVGTYRIFEDVRKENSVRNELALQKNYFDGLLGTSTEALVLLSKDDKVVHFNSAFEDLFGYKLEDAKGRLINDLVAKGELRGEADEISKRALNAESVNEETIRYHKDGRPIPVEISINPVTKKGELLGIYAIYKDLTEKSRIKRELRIQLEYFKQLFEGSMDAIALIDTNQKIVDSNLFFEKIFGYSAEESKGKSIEELIVPKEYLKESTGLMKKILTGKPIKEEIKRISKNGEVIEVEVAGHPILVDGEAVGIIVNYRDIRERKRMLEEIEKQGAYFKQLYDNSPLGIVIIDTQERVVDVNKGFCKIFEYEKAETIGEFINDLIAPESLLDEAEGLSAKLIGGSVVKYETKRRSKTHKLIDVDILAYPVKLNKENVGGYEIYSDITEKKQAEKEIETLAFKDSLTGLFNRRVFYDKLKEKIQNIGKGQKFAVCYIDLDGFKRVNDSLGHNIGDELLRYVAKNIKDSMEKEDVVARMGGDEFVIFTDCADHEKIGAKMESIIERLNSGFKIFDYSIKISLSIGVAIYPDHGNNVEEIIKNADTAMYIAKRNALRGYLIFTAQMEENSNDRFKLENRLKMALANGEIEMHYQPILSMNGRVKGCEALMRWENPAIGKVPPNVFIPIAEDSGEIHQLGAFALNQALIVLKKWKKRFGDDFFMSINLSVKQMERNNIVDAITEIMKKNGIEGKNVHLEITESRSTENVTNLNGKLSRLNKMGFAISIDDFGTGYSCFTQLRDSYASFLKIDRSFVGSIEKRGDNRAIVKAIVAMGESLGVEIIAEGVETEEELKIIKSLGCGMYQGYLSQRPENEKIIEAFIKKNFKD
ncbi:MAG: PAS domain S-box protein [Peptostreptococcaceae bacterium]|nr:PAS domain S-box protein [Peptostreptococcaceae bacterium]